MCMKIDATPIKFVRGQIWFVNEPREVTEKLRNEGSTVINGSRPYIVINVNEELGIVTCCPLTSNTTTLYKSPYDIVFTNTQNVSSYEESRICVSQITTKSFVDFHNYMYSLPFEAIDILMRNISACLGIENSFLFFNKAKETTSKDNAKESKKDATDTRKAEAKYKKADWPLKTKEDGVKFLEKFGDVPGKEGASLFGASKATFYTWRWKATRLANDTGC